MSFPFHGMSIKSGVKSTMKCWCDQMFNKNIQHQAMPFRIKYNQPLEETFIFFHQIHTKSYKSICHSIFRGNCYSGFQLQNKKLHTDKPCFIYSWYILEATSFIEEIYNLESEIQHNSQTKPWLSSAIYKKPEERKKAHLTILM